MTPHGISTSSSFPLVLISQYMRVVYPDHGNCYVAEVDGRFSEAEFRPKRYRLIDIKGRGTYIPNDSLHVIETTGFLV